VGSSDVSLYGKHVAVTKFPATSPINSVKRTPATRMHESALLQDAFSAPIILKGKKKKKAKKNFF